MGWERHLSVSDGLPEGEGRVRHKERMCPLKKVVGRGIAACAGFGGATGRCDAGGWMPGSAQGPAGRGFRVRRRRGEGC